MRITCNVCGSKSIIQSTKDAMPGYAKFYCICTNPKCSHSFVASWSYEKTLNPSLQQTSDLLVNMIQRLDQTEKAKIIKQLGLF
ncbi:ogr/Delta-like zinc finger family protein [Shewanella sp. MTB7]|uniref:ogr/Delta-like zinc finger family protein n=1 Tax=Shewanella sp. MTB7 TaxID=2746932 RepID=UPI0022BA2B76|nr:ogr/Delta-like zinc finger family protein [Shewanella sp. MTB7]WBJ93552.1 ogr/Delta-like zinc finger family protein [Shewanella sp. MTB7]